MQILKKINGQCKKQRKCLHCFAINGVVKKVGALKIAHDKFRWIGKQESDEKVDFDKSFDEAKKANPALENFLNKAKDEDLNPLTVLNLFRLILPSECELVGIDPTKGGPEMYLWRDIPAPPVTIRASIMQDTASVEDDLTVKLADIFWTNSLIKAGLEKGMSIVSLAEQWEYLQLSLALYINADTSSGPGIPNSKPIRALCQRLKGKEGRFRNNLSGKRVDFSGRTVISPDPNLRIDEVGIPDRVAKTLTYPEQVTRYNKEKLQYLISNGPLRYPGANYVNKKDVAQRTNLKFGTRGNVAKNLEIGDVVERHLEDGDVVVFNRQPSLHRLSMLSHSAKILPGRTFRLNECVCIPYNADFDGDEMNIHIPQTEEARAEAMFLMGVENNLVTPKSGEPIIAATQDFITGSYLISNKNQFFNRAEFCQILAMMSDANLQVDIPLPAILKPERLWTGKQVFSLLIRPNKKSRVIINLDAKNKTFQVPQNGFPLEMSPNDGYVLIRGSQVLCGSMDKNVLGDGNKNSIFYTILRDHGPVEAANAINRMAKMCARWLGDRGFSIGIDDVTPGKALNERKDRLIESAYSKCEDLIGHLEEGQLETQPGCNEEQTLEAKIGGLLSKVREDVGDVCINELEKSNAALIMATSGSKGSTLNVSQMVAAVGQQMISGTRIPDGFQDRSLPHFPKFAKTPPSKGFVRNSFYSGLAPTEFLFHAISGREGLVDTAVKTAETGYMARRLMKSMEDVSVKYDNTVRTSSNSIVQFAYGGDGLDPFDMEGDAKPVDFARTWAHCQNITFSNEAEHLLPYQIVDVCDSIIFPLVKRVKRRDNLGNLVDEKDGELEIYVDENDPQRDFFESVREFVFTKASDLSKARERKSMLGLLEVPEREYADIDYDKLVDIQHKIAVDQVCKISRKLVETFLEICLFKYERSKVEPGTAVGAIGAQSIGEPGTQMTLKTFHFAGVASMNVTLGVPRIKEIINASKLISTPIIAACLANDTDERTARIVKGRIEKTMLKDVALYIEEVYVKNAGCISIGIDMQAIERLQLGLSLNDICKAIRFAPKLKLADQDVNVIDRYNVIQVLVRPVNRAGAKAVSVESDLFLRTQHLKRVLPNVVVKGFPNIARAVINIREDSKKELLAEGYGLQNVMITDGVIGYKTASNHVLEIEQVLGIEAARSSIINEIRDTMTKHGMSVDPRHMELLADIMTSKGQVLGITRFGLAKMKDSALQLASFEQTTDHLFDASFHTKTDNVEGVSESIILGQSMKMGTGAFTVVRPERGQMCDLTKQAVFEDLCDVYE